MGSRGGITRTAASVELDILSEAEFVRVRDYEQRNKNGETLLEQIERCACRVHVYVQRQPLWNREYLPPAKGGLMEDSTLKARAICNPASSGGGHEPKELRQEIDGYQLEWITTQSPGDASEAAKEC